MSWIWTALVPHPPIIVPEVGKGRDKEAAKTLEGMEALASAWRSMSRPDCVLLLSPHQPYSPGAVALNASPVARGGFAPFGAPEVSFDLDVPVNDVAVLAEFLRKEAFPVRLGETPDLTRDQGSTVPLYFMRRAYGELPHVIFASPIGLGPDSAYELGRLLAKFDDGAKWALLASGDLSHRLRPGAPAGYSPSGRVFDEAVVAAVSSGDASKLLEMSPGVQEEAGECGLRSALSMLGLCSSLGCGGNIEVLSYEWPFGVGYCTAICKI